MTSPISVLKRHHQMRENTALGRQRLIFFETTAVFSLLLTVASFFYQPKSVFVISADVACMALTLGLLALYVLRYLNVKDVSVSLSLILQVEISVHMLFLSTLGTTSASILVLQDAFLSLMLIMILLVTLFTYTPLTLSLLSFITYLACVVIADSAVVTAFFPIYIVILSGVVFFDAMAARGAKEIVEENVIAKKELREFVRVTGLSLEDIEEIVLLSKKGATSTERTRELLNRMDARLRDNLVGGVLAVKAQNDSSRDRLLAAFPNLTPTQISICQLILQDKKLSEICRTLGKTENNVNAQRSKIRSCLNIPREVPLKEALTEQLGLYLEAEATDKKMFSGKNTEIFNFTSPLSKHTA